MVLGKKTSLMAQRALAHLLQSHTACKIGNGCYWAPKWLMGFGKMFIPMFLGLPSTFTKWLFETSSTTTQPKITLVGLDMKMTLQTTPPQHKLNVSNISAVTDLILMNFTGRFLGTSRTDLIVRVTFVQTTFVQLTFVHIRNISAVTDRILMIF